MRGKQEVTVETVIAEIQRLINGQLEEWQKHSLAANPWGIVTSSAPPVGIHPDDHPPGTTVGDLARAEQAQPVTFQEVNQRFRALADVLAEVNQRLSKLEARHGDPEAGGDAGGDQEAWAWDRGDPEADEIWMRTCKQFYEDVLAGKFRPLSTETEGGGD